MTDEQMARLQSKQEELGVGSTDLMLFDGGYVRMEAKRNYISTGYGNDQEFSQQLNNLLFHFSNHLVF